MKIQEMKQRKKELGYTNEQIARLSGVPLGTVQKVLGGATESPRYETLKALERVLAASDQGMEQSTAMCDAKAAYMTKKQGEYTLEDYYHLPEDQRAELIDGVIYDMSSPLSEHQLVAGLIYSKFVQYVTEKKGACLPIVAPMDVQLDCDDKTIVEPDVMILCDRSRLKRHCVYGAPDFVLEVLSKSTRKKDMVIKLNKYMSAGVKEYWMVDIDARRVLVYVFEQDNYPVIYGFDDKVPVSIWNGECEIDFAEVYDYIRFLVE